MNNDQRRIEMAHSLMFSLPGCQAIRYGDEIGMGDDLSLEGRKAVRTPMQWSDVRNAGFSTAAPEDLIRPVIASGDYNYRQVNMQAQVRDPDSLLSRFERLIRIRRSTPEIGLGKLSLMEMEQPSVMAHSYDWHGRKIVAVHNLAGNHCTMQLRLHDGGEGKLLDLNGDRLYPPPAATIEIAPYGYRWFRLVRDR